MSISLPSGVTTIGQMAFYNCSSLMRIEFPNGVTGIGEYAFCNCSSMTSVSIPDSITAIGTSAFQDCSGLTSVHITDLAAWCNIEFGLHFHGTAYSNPLYYAENLYLNNELVVKLVVPEGITAISDFTFWGCTSITSVVFPESMTVLEGWHVGLINLKTVYIPVGVTLIKSQTMSQVEKIVYCGTEAQWNAISKQDGWDGGCNISVQYHEYDMESASEIHHKGVCIQCGAESEIASHSFGDGVVTKNPTYTEEGERTYTCSECGATKTETIAKEAAPSTGAPDTDDPIPDESVTIEDEEITSEESSSAEKEQDGASGCSSTVTVGAGLMLLLTLGASVLVKKKED